MEKDFDNFMSQLRRCIVHFDYFVDFDKARQNVHAIEIKLNTLNFLIGKKDLKSAIQELWDVNPNVFDVLEILIAVRAKDQKSVADEYYNPIRLSEFLKSPDGIYDFMMKSGIGDVLINKEVKNLVDYVFGVEVGMDTNARKNRGGKIMENFVAEIFDEHNVVYTKQVSSKKMPQVQAVLGKDKKVFDFVVKTRKKTYLIEVNFFSDDGGGSKLNEVSRSFDGLTERIKSFLIMNLYGLPMVQVGMQAQNKLEEAYINIPKLYNLTSIVDFIQLVKEEGQ